MGYKVVTKSQIQHPICARQQNFSVLWVYPPRKHPLGTNCTLYPVSYRTWPFKSQKTAPSYPADSPFFIIAASGGGVLPQRGAEAALLAPARRLPSPRHHRRRLQRRTPLRRPVNKVIMSLIINQVTLLSNKLRCRGTRLG